MSMYIRIDNWILRLAIVSTPSAAPQIWTIVNTTLFCYSTILLIILGFRDEGDIEYDLLVTQWYLTYDIVICVIWLIETSLTMVDTWIVVPTNQQLLSLSIVQVSESASSNKMPWVLIVMWIVALHMLLDGIFRITNKIVDDDYPTSDMLLDVGMNYISYGYIIIVQYIQRRTNESNSNDNSIDNDTTTNNNYHYNTIITTTTTTTISDTHNKTLLPSYQSS